MTSNDADMSGRAGGIEPVQPGIWRLPIPLHARAEPVNSWLLVDERSGAVTILDAGIAAGAAERYAAALEAIDRRPEDVVQLVVSHQHPDHVGGSGAVHALTGARVLSTQSTAHQVVEVWGDGGNLERYMERIRAHLAEHGLPDEIGALLARTDVSSARAAIELAPPAAWQAIEDDDEIEAGGRTWRVIATPGHADGQFVLHDAASGLLLSADHLLERISPAVGRFPGHEEDPLGRYLESLQRVEEIAGAPLVLPGHGAPFRDAGPRAAELRAHHEARLQAAVRAVARIDGGATAYDVARIIFPRVFEPADGDPVSIRFATTETLAHLEHARVRGLIERTSDGPTTTWRCAETTSPVASVRPGAIA